MHRISSQMSNNDTQFNLRLQESRQNKINNQIGSQQRLQSLREDPLAAGHLVRHQSFLGRMERFEKNALTLSDQYAVRDGYMQQTVEVMQRVRELAVGGANGIYNKDDLKNMASEVDELLKELVQNANAVNQDGILLFAGTHTNGHAFDVVMGTAAGASEPVIHNVRYNGNIGTARVEIDENAYITVENSGSKLFWAEPQALFAQRDATAWQATEDSVIVVDGQEISVTAGDNVYSLIAKINDSGAAVKAHLDPVTSGLNLNTTDARQLWLEDKSGNVLETLGLVKDKSQRPPYNLGDSVRVSGGSLFDTVIALRDAMLTGDTESIGGKILGAIDSGLNNVVSGLAASGSAYERLQLNARRDSATALNVTQMIAREGDVDFTKAITDMKLLDYVNQATLSNAGRMYSSTLLNYMR